MSFWIQLDSFILISSLIASSIILYTIAWAFKRQKNVHRRKTCRTMICLGSGGHTTEMLTLIKTIDFTKYTPRCYIVANTDDVSLEKLSALEKPESMENTVLIEKIPRSRHVNQSYLSSVITTLNSILYCIPVVMRFKPDLILCNGPGTCIPICMIAFLARLALILDTRIIFIESFCRTKTLSLSGRILLYIADHFVVQWPSLKQKVKRADYLGQLM